MPIKITLAKTAKEIDAIFKLRSQLLAQSISQDEPTSNNKARYLNDEGRSLNRFDGFPETSHLVVKDDDKVVGSLRLCLDSDAGIPADAIYNFRSQLPYSYRVLCCDMYCVGKNYHNPKIAEGLILMASYIAIAHKATHIVAPINTAIAELMKKIGCKIVGDETKEPATGLNVVPVILDLSTLDDFFINFIKTNHLYEFLDSYECIFYNEGDYIIKAGEKGDCVYVMVDGEANVMHPKKFKLIKTLKAGNVFGEIALLSDEGVRTANVVTKNSVRVMRLDKETFMDYLFNNPKKAMEFMTQISKQTQQLNDYNE